MKKNLTLITALVLLGFAPRAYALSEQCETALSPQFTPVSSHYVQKVLDRADEAIAYIKDESAHPKNADFSLYMGDWALSIGSAWTQLLDSELRFTVQQESLLSQTACMRFDMLLIECKMEQVRDEMNAQISTGQSWTAIHKLQELVHFLNERYRNLNIGAHDATYVDTGWGLRYSFDPPEQTWCCPESGAGNTCAQMEEQICIEGEGQAFESLDQCVRFGCVAPDDVPAEEKSMCPYTADYAPPFPSGFGCDIETLEKLQDFMPVRDEYEALKKISDQAKEYREAAREFLQVQQKIDEIFGRTPVLPSPPADRKHLEAFGCGWQGGYCTDNPRLTCMEDDECGDDGECLDPDGSCQKNHAIRCFDSVQCGENDVCERIETVALPSTQELRGPFSSDKNQVGILADFLELRTVEGYSREFSDDLKTADEFSREEEDERKDRSRDRTNTPVSALRSSIRLLFQTWSRMQGREEAATFPVAMDPQLEVAESLTQLRKAVGDIARLATKEDGLRQFVLRYAWFLRRTCMDRMCALSLEQIIKIALADECFPYTNGDYLGDSEGDPRREKCMEAAGIDLE